MSRLAKQSGLVLGLTFVAYVLAYMRDATIAAYVGTSAAADAYFVAMVVPLMLYQVSVNGMLLPAFQPVIIEYLETDDGREVWKVASVVLHLFLLLLMLVIVVGVLATPTIIRVIAPGLATATQALAAQLLRLMFPLLILVGLAGFFGALLNALDHFTFPALGPAVSNLVVVAGVLLAVPRWGAYGLAFATLAGAVAHVFVLIPVLLKKGAQYVPSLDVRHSGVRQMGTLSVPLLLFLLQAQVTPFVERNLGSGLGEGSIATLNYAMKLYNLPNVVFGTSIITVLSPSFARFAARRDLPELRRIVGRGISLLAFFTIPTAVWLGVSGLSAVRLLYERGSFAPSDSIRTATVLTMYTLGIVPAGVYALLVRTFHSLQDMVTPLLVGLATTAVYVPLSFWLTGRLGLIGLPLSLATITWLASIGSLAMLQRRIGSLELQVVASLGRITLASVVMGTICWLWQRYALSGVPEGLSQRGNIVTVVSLLGIGAGTYGVAGFMLRLPEIRLVGSFIRRYLGGADRQRCVPRELLERGVDAGERT